jgi:hypothetical protein
MVPGSDGLFLVWKPLEVKELWNHQRVLGFDQLINQVFSPFWQPNSAERKGLPFFFFKPPSRELTREGRPLL